MEWISVEDRLPPSGMEYSWLITDGEEVGIGYYETEYFSDDPQEPLQYRSATWHQDGHHLKTDLAGFPEVTHWMSLPELPNKS